MKLLSLLHFFKLNLTLLYFLPKCFFQKKTIENFKTVSNGLFSHAPLIFWKNKIDTAASNREAINNFEILRCPLVSSRLKLCFWPEINKLWPSNASSAALVLSSLICLKISSNVLPLPCSIICGREKTRHGMDPRRLVSRLAISLKWLANILFRYCRTSEGPNFKRLWLWPRRCYSMTSGLPSLDISQAS